MPEGWLLLAEESERIRSAPDESFHQLESACRSKNDEWRVTEGLSSLMSTNSSFTIDCLYRFPAVLFRTACILGSFSQPLRQEVLKAWCQHRLVDGNIESAEAETVIEILRETRTDGIENPVPRKFLEHLKGRVSLTCGQADRAMRQIRSRLNLVRLQLLEEMALRRASRGLKVDPHDPPSKHALQVMMLLDTNRRILRRFMQAGASGQYLHDHSLNQEWLRSHPVVDGRLWTRGIHVQGDLDGELVTLALEGNPLEVLRMGTYPGSCLGLGGDFTYSAVAVMLDINKQVIYARNCRGKVIGRQLLAISQENTLVCFGVYPNRVPEKLKEMFVDYDKRFAMALGMELHDPDVDDECEIDLLIAEEWWDDGAWDLTSA